uniref:30S ribosomal protein S17, chloroplastic n=1 Tax=Erigeron canadensis TaxID=72917 RepID=UPI001CB8C7A6|nr:30S ribosomal protein S17, chloroplastic [Erigeron canadensis]
MSLLHLQLPISQLKSLTLSTSFLHGSTTIPAAPSPTTTTHLRRPTCLPPIRAMRSLQGRVINTVNDKTVSVEVTRLAPHPKYKRRVRKKKKFQAHDPENQFEIGDIVQLEKCKPISKMKTFLAIPVPKRNTPKKTQEDLGIPLESDSSETV